MVKISELNLLWKNYCYRTQFLFFFNALDFYVLFFSGGVDLFGQGLQLYKRKVLGEGVLFKLNYSFSDFFFGKTRPFFFLQKSTSFYLVTNKEDLLKYVNEKNLFFLKYKDICFTLDFLENFCYFLKKDFFFCVNFYFVCIKKLFSFFIQNILINFFFFYGYVKSISQE